MDFTAIDILIFGASLIAGIISIVIPEKAYNLLQTKKRREVYTEKTRKTMIYSGIVLVVLAVGFVVLSFFS